MNKVFVLDQDKKPLAPCTHSKANKLLRQKRASIYLHFPFTIRLYDSVENPVSSPLRLKFDPGSKVTGVAILDEKTAEVIWAAEIVHRGQQIRNVLQARLTMRRERRARKTRYRAPRLLNRKRKEGWLAPSLQSRVSNVETWARRLCRLVPIKFISMELVSFDTQALENPEIKGVEYQQGTLAGYEVRQYLLEKWGRECAYCGKKDVPLQIEHIWAKSKGGSDRVSNLALSCEPCNNKKGNQPVAKFLAKKLECLAKILAQTKASLRDAAVMNATKFVIYRVLQSLNLPIETGTGGRTKYNRTKQKLLKSHWIDAACVGASTPAKLIVTGVRPLVIEAKGHGTRLRTGINKYGFPIRTFGKGKTFDGFQTGDMVRAVIPKGTNQGAHIGRISIRYRPSFRLLDFDVHPKYLTILQLADGYSYSP